jgi:diphthamide synthase (EF-2-diphthine--ammonia ligase)
MSKGIILWSGGKDSAYSLYKARQQGIEVTHAITGFFRDMLIPPEEATIKAQVSELDMTSIILPCDLVTFHTAVEKTIKKMMETHGIDCVIHGESRSASNVIWFRDMCKTLGVTPILPCFNLTIKDQMDEMFAVGFKFIITRLVTYDADLAQQYGGQTYTKEIYQQVLITHDNLTDNPLGPGGILQTFVYDSPNFKTPLDISMDPVMFSRVKLR